MSITINGTGSITGLTAGGLPDASVTADDLASNAVTTTKVADANITTAKIADANITAAKLDGAQSGSAPIYGARAWVNFNGTGTVAIRASGNVSSITDNGVGDYTVNFTTAMADANYCVNYTGGYKTGVDARTVNVLNSDIPQTSSSVRLKTLLVDASAADTDRCNVAIFR